ncbi:small nuclear ribonucleoprotein-associated protein B'-like [Dromiciops gliroides]|uniref:small nuclear ribonucleoprotein-associated protein B'-like n=1 Tax=Dromiciops gliroides TaxID=33562 RepID=UPI001CC4B2AF|nr:small nuclear ribonucleoprotein-associated protein B'-like [Dromiciops gliroides]
MTGRRQQRPPRTRNIRVHTPRPSEDVAAPKAEASVRGGGTSGGDPTAGSEPEVGPGSSDAGIAAGAGAAAGAGEEPGGGAAAGREWTRPGSPPLPRAFISSLSARAEGPTRSGLLLASLLTPGSAVRGSLSPESSLTGRGDPDVLLVHPPNLYPWLSAGDPPAGRLGPPDSFSASTGAASQPLEPRGARPASSGLSPRPLPAPPSPLHGVCTLAGSVCLLWGK